MCSGSLHLTCGCGMQWWLSVCAWMHCGWVGHMCISNKIYSWSRLQLSVQPSFPQVVLCLCWDQGRKMTPSSSQRSLLTCSEISMNGSVSCLTLAAYKVLLLCCLSIQAAVLFKVVTLVSVAFPACPVLNQLTFKVPDSKSHWFYKLLEFSSSGF